MKKPLIQEWHSCKNCKKPITTTARKWHKLKPYCTTTCKEEYRNKLYKEALNETKYIKYPIEEPTTTP